MDRVCVLDTRAILCVCPYTWRNYLLFRVPRSSPAWEPGLGEALMFPEPRQAGELLGTNSGVGWVERSETQDSDAVGFRSSTQPYGNCDVCDRHDRQLM